MDRTEVFEKLNEIFQDVFDDDTLEVNENTTSEDIEEWDSLMHISLIMAIENAFGIKFTMDEVTGMQNVGETADKIMEKI